MEDEDLIRKQMKETRSNLTDKLETLEHQVVGTAQAATSAVSDSVEAVKETVQDTVASVQETVATVKESIAETVTAVKDSMHEGVDAVKGLFDVSAHVERHPWLMLGGSVALGYLLNGFLGKASPARDRGVASGISGPSPVPSPNGSSGNGAPTNGNFREERKPEAALEQAASLFSSFGPEINKLKGLAIGALLGTVREMIVKAVPEQFAGQLKEIIDSVTEKAGGEPIAQVPWAAADKHEVSNSGGYHEEPDETKMGGSVGAVHRQGQETVGCGHG